MSDSIMLENYVTYLCFLDGKFKKFFEKQKPFIFCKIGCSATILKFHTIGVNQKHNCIIIPSACSKSGTNVVSADVNLVTARIKQLAANIIYISINRFGI